MSPAGGAWNGLLALLLLTGCASIHPLSPAESGETVEAEGWAPIDPKDMAGTRRRALAEAQKKAVEKVTGVFLAASTRIDAAIAIRQRIMAAVRGYIRRYDILGEKTEAGFHKTRIRALVMRRKLGEEDRDWDATAAEPPPENSRVSLTIIGKGQRANSSSASALSAIRNNLLTRGFQVTTAAPAPSSATLNLIVKGEARAYEISDPRLGEFISYRGRITLEVIEPKSGAVIWTRSQEASALDVDSDSASSQAIANAGALIGTAAADKLTAYLWKRF